MTEDNRSVEIGRDVKESVIIPGDGNTATITITNYYYREDTAVIPVESTDAADENLPCPYRGLFHFGPDDAKYFFGREVFIEELFVTTQTSNFIPLLGASGSGKSSVVLAGLVPKLQQEGNWLFTHFRPGSDPFHAHKIESPNRKARALSAIAQVYGKLDKLQNAEELLKRVITFTDTFTENNNSSLYKDIALRNVVQVIAKLSQPKKAASLLQQATNSADKISDSRSKAQALSAIAEVAAKYKNWGLALKAINECPSDDCRVYSLTKVLTVHAEQKNPELKEKEE